MRVSAGVRFNRYHRLQNYGRSPKSVLIGAWHHRVDSYPASAQLLGHVNGEHLKSPEQQATLMLHKTRELLVKQRTMSVNALRGHLSEFGIVAAKGIGRVDELLDLAESDATLPNAARASVKVLAQALEGLDKAIDDLEKEIFSAHAQNEMSRLLDKVPGIGKLIASVIAASVPDPSVFKSGRDFAAFLGLTPRQTRAAASRRSEA